MDTSGAEPRPVLAILNYGIGNLHSAHKGFAHAGADARLTADRDEIMSADGLVLPGVGAFGPCMAALDSSGLAEVALERIEAGVPFFGICIGMQVLYGSSQEAPGVSGLGVFDGEVTLIPGDVKRPQMQWNVLDRQAPDHPMFDGLGEQSWMYFVHSYAATTGPKVLATCDYGADLVAAVVDNNVWACQFHPEKSGRDGLQILENFVTETRRARDEH